MSAEDRLPFQPGAAPPLGERRRTLPDFRRTPVPYVCWTIIGLSVACFAFDSYFLGPGEHFGVLYGPAVHDGQYWRLLSHVVEHGGPWHLLFNMSVVYSLGMGFERVIGHARFALISFITALGSATLALLLQYDVPMLGASGMILGWAGAILPVATKQGRREIGTWLAYIVVISLLPRVSWQGHLGGFLLGLPCGALLRLGPKRFWMFAPILAVVALTAALWASRALPF